jgi:hypothetical protein
MQNPTDTPEPAQALSEIRETAPAAAHSQEACVGDGSDSLALPLTAEEVAQLTAAATSDDVTETNIRGHRVLIVGGMHHRGMMAAALLSRLAEEGALVVRSDEKLVGLERPELADICLRAAEPLVLDIAYEERKGNRRKDWQSPYGNVNGYQHKGRQPQRNIKQMLRRRGGR